MCSIPLKSFQSATTTLDISLPDAWRVRAAEGIRLKVVSAESVAGQYALVTPMSPLPMIRNFMALHYRHARAAIHDWISSF